MSKELLLTQGKIAVVDDADYEWLSQWSWYYNQGYAVRTINDPDRTWSVRMHRVILNAPPGVQVDHVDGDKLNNRRSNLRLCDATGNARNCRSAAGSTSRFKGVSWDKASRAWRAYIGKEYQLVHLGLFDDEVTAARVHDSAAREMHGEYAYLNFPERPPLTAEEIQCVRRKMSKTSRYRGVTWDKVNQKWMAAIHVQPKAINLGRYADEETAARVYDWAARELHGESARLNLPEYPPLNAEEVKRIRRKVPKTSRFRGVCWDQAKRKWMAAIQVQGKAVNLGRFSSELDAARVYNEAARRYHGDRAILNSI